MKIIVFGTGKYYSNRKEQLKKISCDDEIVAFIDNKAKKKESFEGIQLLPPRRVADLEYDYILLMSTKTVEMENQLIKLGIVRKKIMRYQEYVSQKHRGEISLYIQNYLSCKRKRVLLITTMANYNGGSLVAFYAVKALQEQGYDAWLMTSKISPELLKEMGSEAINVAVCPSLPFISNQEMYWIQQFDIVIVNVFQMVASVVAISKYKPTVWWIHEPSEKYDSVYKNAMDEYSKYTKLEYFHHTYIVGVSEIAKQNFEHYFPNRVNAILPYGIPDEMNFTDKNVNKSVMVFAIIGGVTKLKAQHIFVEAAQSIIRCHSHEVEFWIIGPYGIDDYAQHLEESICDIPEIKMLGNLTRKKLKEIFTEIDVVVCSSMEETMSLTITEGMMHGKICITTDATGMANYINDGENGFICKAGDVASLRKKMMWVLNNPDDMMNIKMNARKSYEEYFSLHHFGNRLEKALRKAEIMYEG